MEHRLSPDIRLLLREDEEVEFVACGGFGAVREYFVLTDSRILVARQLGPRMQATAFDRDKELWMELRPNRQATDFLVCSAETMERIRNLTDADQELVKSHFGIGEGEIEDVVARPDRMYKIFEGLPGTNDAALIPTTAQTVFLALTVAAFGLLAFEGGRLLGPLRGGEGTLAWWLLGCGLAVSAILVKSSLQVAALVAVGAPALVWGVDRSAPGLHWDLTSREAAAVGLVALAAWILATALQRAYREPGETPPLPPPAPGLALDALILVSLVLVAVHQQAELAPWEQRRFVRSVRAAAGDCAMDVWRGTPDRVVIHDDATLLLASLAQGPRAPWDAWTFPTTTSPVPRRHRFDEGWLMRIEGSRLTAFSLERGGDAWNFTFPQPSGRVVVPDDIRISASRQTVLVVASTGETAALDLATGGRRWLRRFPDEAETSFSRAPRLVSAPRDTVLVELPGCCLYCLRAETGEIVWRIDLDSTAQPVAATATAAIVAEAGMIRLHGLETGAPLWHRPLPGRLVAPPFRFWEDGAVGAAVAAGNIQVLLFDAASGHLNRTCTLTGTVSGDLDGSHLEDGLISWSTGLWRFALKGNPDGWRLELPGEVTRLAATPVRHEGRVYAATSTGFLLALDDDSGDLVWRYRTRGQAVTGGLAVTLRGPLLLTGTGFLYAFNR